MSEADAVRQPTRLTRLPGVTAGQGRGGGDLSDNRLRLRRDLKGARRPASPDALLEHEHAAMNAFDRSAYAESGLQVQAQRIIAIGGDLIRVMVEHASIEGEEVRRAKLAGQRLARDGQNELLAHARQPGLNRVEPHRGGLDGGGDERRAVAIHRRFADLKRQFERAALRDADVLADQPGRLAGDRHPARRGVGGDRHRNGQGDRIGIAVIGERAEIIGLRRRPDDVSSRPALRQIKRDPRRLSGIAGIAPIGVPALGDFLMQGDVDAFARRRGLPVGDQARLHHRAGAGESRRLRGGLHGQGGCGEKEKSGEEANGRKCHGAATPDA